MCVYRNWDDILSTEMNKVQSLKMNLKNEKLSLKQLSEQIIYEQEQIQQEYSDCVTSEDEEYARFFY